MTGAFLGQLVGIQLACIDTASITNPNAPLPTRGSILALQTITTSSAFIVSPLLYLYFFAAASKRRWFSWKQGHGTLLLLTLSLALAFMITNTWFVHWNMTIKLPDWLRTFEAWAQQQEAAIQRVSDHLTTFHSLQDLGTGVLVIGVIPAVGEELLFRGLIQSLCYQITRNIHSAIIISALAFSAVHLQFYGFVPRLLLGALFGYIYWWTKDLLFPIAAHFFNNAFTLLLLFLHQRGLILQDMIVPTVLPKPVLLFSALLVVVFSYYLKQLSKKRYA